MRVAAVCVGPMKPQPRSRPPPAPPAVMVPACTTKTMPSAPCPSRSEMPCGFVLRKVKDVLNEAWFARLIAFVRKALRLAKPLFPAIVAA